ncbi:hypothetical protein NMY22_g12754 [Coprinellus aureogranulatus]|nr:hypothetical protein NMY22_g12754 [Coprinellus aureogranulatus]
MSTDETQNAVEAKGEMNDVAPASGDAPAQSEPTRKRPRLNLGALTGGDRKRGKSMLGLVVGTLNKAKVEDKERNASEAAKKRQLIEQRLQIKLRKETDSVRRAEEAKKDKTLANRKEEDLQLKDSIYKLRRKRLPTLANFLLTSDHIPSDDSTPPPSSNPLAPVPRSHPPPLYYLPAVLTPAQEAFIARRRAEVTEAAEKEWEQFKEERDAGIREINELRQKVADEEARQKAEREGMDADTPIDTAPTESKDAESISTDKPQEPAKDAAMDVDDSGSPPKESEKSESAEKKDEPAPMQADDDDALLLASLVSPPKRVPRLTTLSGSQGLCVGGCNVHPGDPRKAARWGDDDRKGTLADAGRLILTEYLGISSKGIEGIQSGFRLRPPRRESSMLWHPFVLRNPLRSESGGSRCPFEHSPEFLPHIEIRITVLSNFAVPRLLTMYPGLSFTTDSQSGSNSTRLSYDDKEKSRYSTINNSGSHIDSDDVYPLDLRRTGARPESPPPIPPKKSTPRKLLWAILLGPLVLALVVGIPVGLAFSRASRVDTHQENAKEPPSANGTGRTDVEPTTGGDGSIVKMEDGTTFVYSNPFGGYCWYSPLRVCCASLTGVVCMVGVYDPNNPVDDSARPNSWTPPLNESWDWNNGKIYGVNLGGLFVLEPFITPALYQRYDGALDEWTLSTMMAADTANGGLNQLEEHYNTFIASEALSSRSTFTDFGAQTEKDIAEIAGAGLNWVRLPIPFWAIETWAGEPFLAKTSWKYIVRLLGWCRKYGLRVNLDLHTIPGSQNGYNHSGRAGEINFMQGIMGLANAQRALNYIRTITEFISQPEWRNVVPFFGILNEPIMPVIGVGQLQSL